MAQGDEAAHFDGGAAVLAAEHQIGEAAPATELKRLPKKHPTHSLTLSLSRSRRKNRKNISEGGNVFKYKCLTLRHEYSERGRAGNGAE